MLVIIMKEKEMNEAAILKEKTTWMTLSITIINKANKGRMLILTERGWMRTKCRQCSFLNLPAIYR